MRRVPPARKRKGRWLAAFADESVLRREQLRDNLTPRMTADDIKRLRGELGCSLGELAAAVGVETRVLLAWESGDEFPTKKHSDKLRKLGEAGPDAVPKKGRAKAANPMTALSDPRLWTLFRKLLAHPALRTEVERLAEKYDDPGK